MRDVFYLSSESKYCLLPDGGILKSIPLRRGTGLLVNNHLTLIDIQYYKNLIMHQDQENLPWD